MIPPHTNRYPKPPSGAATGWGRFFLCWGERAAAGGCGGVKTPPYGAKDTWAVMASVEGRACPAPTGCPNGLRTRGAREGGSPPPLQWAGRLPFPVHRLFHAVPKPMTLAQNAAASASMGKPSPVCGSAAGAAAFTVRVPALAADAVTAAAAVSGGSYRFTNSTPSAFAVSPLRTAQSPAANRRPGGPSPDRDRVAVRIVGRVGSAAAALGKPDTGNAPGSSKAKPVKYTVPPFFTVRARCTGAGAASSGVSSTV